MAEEGSKTILHREFTESIKKQGKNKAHRKHRHLEGYGYSLKRGKWWAGTLVNALRVAKIRSNLHTGQYASGVPYEHGQRQALVEPLSLPGVAWNVNKFLCETAQEGGSGLAIHTSGFDCNWLKVIIVKKVIVFPAFVGLSISCYTAWYSGTDYVLNFCKGVHNCLVPYKAPASVPGFQGQTIGPSIFRQANGLKDRRRPMWVNDCLRMEFMAECLGQQLTFLMQKRPWSPRLSTSFPQRHSVLSKILAPVGKAIAIRSSSGLSRFLTLAIGKASDLVAVWLFCAVSNRQWFQGLGVSSSAASASLQARSSQADCVSFCRGDESW